MGSSVGGAPALVMHDPAQRPQYKTAAVKDAPHHLDQLHSQSLGI